MLVLTRKPGEKIYIGAEITLTVTEIRGNKVRLGIDAPDDVHVLRSELNEFLRQPTRESCHSHGALERHG